MEQQEQQQQQEQQYYLENQMTIKLYPTVMRLPLTDKRKIILSTLISTQECLADKLIDYKGELFKFYFRQEYIFRTLNIPKTTFEYNMRWLRKNGYLRYRKGCIPGTNKHTTYFYVDTEFVFEMEGIKINKQEYRHKIKPLHYDLVRQQQTVGV